MLALPFALALALSSGTPVPFPALDDVGWHVEKIADGVWAAVAAPAPGGGPLCNAGIVDLGGAALVFDAGFSPRHGAALAQAAAKLTGARVAYLVDSHGHGDHARGNGGFPSDVVVIGTAKMAAQMEREWPKDGKKVAADARADLARSRADEAAAKKKGDSFGAEEAALWATMQETEAGSAATLGAPRLPTVLVGDDGLELRGTRRSVRIVSLGHAHSDSDLALFVPDAKTVFAGDVVFAAMHPFVADGDPVVLRKALGTLRALAPAVVVPGHGPVSGASSIDEMNRWLDAATATAADLKKHGKKPEAAAIPKAYAAWHLRRFFTIDVGFLAARPAAKAP